MTEFGEIQGPRPRWRLAGTGPVAGTIVLVLTLLLLIPPHGILSDNEENYFALAERFVDGGAWPPANRIVRCIPTPDSQ